MFEAVFTVDSLDFWLDLGGGTMRSGLLLDWRSWDDTVLLPLWLLQLIYPSLIMSALIILIYRLADSTVYLL